MICFFSTDSTTEVQQTGTITTRYTLFTWLLSPDITTRQWNQEHFEAILTPAERIAGVSGRGKHPAAVQVSKSHSLCPSHCEKGSQAKRGALAEAHTPSVQACNRTLSKELKSVLSILFQQRAAKSVLSISSPCCCRFVRLLGSRRVDYERGIE